ncbi:MAG: hypothetical protein JO257_34945, partial [Deltaproteobacteria bacterium]|nr:hypothetical protein [Deltaproteobacteria bacterium]
LLYFCSRACTKDSDCPSAMTCAADGCRYREPSPGAIGSPCTGGSDCTSSTCRDQVCTVGCFGNPDACPAHYECRGQGLDQYCIATPAGCGGCAGDPGAPWWLVLGIAWWVRSRQRNTASTN